MAHVAQGHWPACSSGHLWHRLRKEQWPWHLSDRRHLLALGPIFSQTCCGHPSSFNNTQGGTETCGKPALLLSFLALVSGPCVVWPELELAPSAASWCRSSFLSLGRMFLTCRGSDQSPCSVGSLKIEWGQECDGWQELATSGCSPGGSSPCHLLLSSSLTSLAWPSLFASSSSSGTWFPGCYWGGAGEFLRLFMAQNPVLLLVRPTWLPTFCLLSSIFGFLGPCRSFVLS